MYLLVFFIPISNAAIEIIFMLTLVLFLIKKFLKPDFHFLHDRGCIFLALFLIFSAFSLVNSGIYLNKAVKALICKWLEYIGILIIVTDTIGSPRRLRNALVISLAVCGLVAADAIFQGVTGVDFLRFKGLSKWDWRVTASFKSGNGLAAYLVPHLILIVTLLFFRPMKKQFKFFLFFLAAIATCAIVLTGSRGAWLSFLAALALTAALSKKFKAISVVILVFLVIIVLVPVLRERMISVFLPGQDASRRVLNSISWQMISENPFLGKGVGTYMNHFKSYASAELGIQYAHNTFLQIWAECGIFALLSFILFLEAVLFRGARLYKIKNNPVILALVCAASGFLIHSAFETQLYSLQLAAFFWFFMGMAMAANRLELKAFVMR